jgi:TonB family protein
VSNVRVVSGSPPGVFNGVTVAAVQQWHFKPSASGAQGRRTTIRFKLK